MGEGWSPARDFLWISDAKISAVRLHGGTGETDNSGERQNDLSHQKNSPSQLAKIATAKLKQ
jgi:hypothetical protein